MNIKNVVVAILLLACVGTTLPNEAGEPVEMSGMVQTEVDFQDAQPVKELESSDAAFDSFEGLIGGEQTFEVHKPTFTRRMLIKFGAPLFLKFLDAKNSLKSLYARTLIAAGWRTACEDHDQK